MTNVSVSLNSKRVAGEGGVTGTIPAGTFSANRLEADLEARTIALVGNARLRMVPGQLRMPGNLSSVQAVQKDGLGS